MTVFERRRRKIRKLAVKTAELPKKIPKLIPILDVVLRWLVVMGGNDGLAVGVPVEEDVLVDESPKVVRVESTEVLDNGKVEIVENSCRSVGAGA